MILLQLEGNRIGTGLTIVEFSRIRREVVSLFRDPRLIKFQDHKSRSLECFPVVREWTVKPDRLGGEMPPRRIHAFPPVEVRKTPPIVDFLAVTSDSGTALRKARQLSAQACFGGDLLIVVGQTDRLKFSTGIRSMLPLVVIIGVYRRWQVISRSLFFTGSARKSSSLIRRSSLTLYPLRLQANEYIRALIRRGPWPHIPPIPPL